MKFALKKRKILYFKDIWYYLPKTTQFESISPKNNKIIERLAYNLGKLLNYATINQNFPQKYEKKIQLCINDALQALRIIYPINRKEKSINFSS